MWLQQLTHRLLLFCIYELDLRLNNINLYQSLSFIIYINLNHHCHHYWTSESLLNLWKCTQGSDITNKWVVHFVIVSSNTLAVFFFSLFLHAFFFSLFPCFSLSNFSCLLYSLLNTVSFYYLFQMDLELLLLLHFLILLFKYVSIHLEDI